ncbi:MAG: hypothetical protein M1828_006288 [Chrysothrix sp. TS-e1954]|nr:MAG: hypothetical protein M1828_006288 [Chrysothrix sp. TS-e1954]
MDNNGFTSHVAPERANAIMSQLQRQRRAAAIVVPTDDNEIRARLRELGQPITLFGEGRSERRDRLRELLTQQQEAIEAGVGDTDGDRQMREDDQDQQDQDEDGVVQGEFWSEGSEAILAVRQEIARMSVKRAARRIQFQKQERNIHVETHTEHRNKIKGKLQGIELFGSQTADRPVSITRFSPNGELAACGDWGGTVKLLDIPNLNTVKLVKAHRERVGGISWYPNATLASSGVSKDSLNFASAGGDGLIKLWSLASQISGTSQPLATLAGHDDKVIKIDFHPTAPLLASASHDGHWGLWDVRTSSKILLQDGHSREVTNVVFNGDGSLLASAGMDSVGRIWDLRTGRTTMILEGHIKTIHGLDWGPDCYRVLTGSADASVRCWDLRMVKEVSMIAGNSNGVTDLRWFKGTDAPSNWPEAANGVSDHEQSSDGLARPPPCSPKFSGTFYISSGFDHNVRIVLADTWTPIRTLSGHSGHVLSTDVTNDAKWFISGGYDRTVKLWSREDGTGVYG